MSRASTFAWRCLALLFALCWTVPLLAREKVTDLREGEELLLFPGLCYSPDGGKSWVIQLQGCVYQEADSAASGSRDKSRRMDLLEKLLGWYGIQVSAAERRTFEDRARLFMVDNESGRRIVVRCAGVSYDLGKTRANGHFSGKIELVPAQADHLRLAHTNRAFVEACLPDGREAVRSEVTVVPPSGWIVVSDIDDTIKLSLVTHPQALLRSTFIEPFRSVHGMSELYGSWAEKAGASFIYVSGSPWQLYLPLAELTHAEKFPHGVFYLKDFRLKDHSISSLWANPERHKIGAIEPLLKRFNHHHFVLVGDTGERDPEIYGALARKYPDRISKILIRNVTAETTSSERLRKAFEGLKTSKWTLFRNPADLTNSLTMPLLAR